MNYAVIENRTVTNIIWLYPTAATENHILVPTGLSVAIGDTYENGRFYRNGAEIKTHEQLQYAEALTAIDELLLVIGG